MNKINEISKHKNTTNSTIDTVTPFEFNSTPISISTCTLTTFLNSKINIGLISRFINIYEQYSP